MAQSKPYHAPMTKLRRRLLREMALRCSGIDPYTGVAWSEKAVIEAHAIWKKLGRPRWVSMCRSIGGVHASTCAARTRESARCSCGARTARPDKDTFVAVKKNMSDIRRTSSERRKDAHGQGGKHV